MNPTDGTKDTGTVMAKVTAIKYSGVFYLKVMLMSFLLWLWLELATDLMGVLEDPGLLRILSIAFAVLCVALAWHLRVALYPDLGWFRAAKKVDGEYRFES